MANVTLSVEGGVGTIRFANGEFNYATVPLMRGIADRLEEADADHAVRAVVLLSQGKVFSAGGDLATKGGFGTDASDPIRAFYDQVLRLYGTAKPIVAAVQGAAVGAGLGLAVAADFRVAAPEARFAANFVKLGFHAGFGLSVTLVRLIGEQRAAEMMLTGERYKAEVVGPWGLVDHLADASTLPHAATDLARRIAANAPLSLIATRRTLRGNLHDRVRAALDYEHAEQMKLIGTADYAEGLKAVGERRPGNFTGR